MLKSSILFTVHCVCAFRDNATLAFARFPQRQQRSMCTNLPSAFFRKGGTGYDLSLKDLSMIERIGELADAGVTSFKN